MDVGIVPPAPIGNGRHLAGTTSAPGMPFPVIEDGFTLHTSSSSAKSPSRLGGRCMPLCIFSLVRVAQLERHAGSGYTGVIAGYLTMVKTSVGHADKSIDGGLTQRRRETIGAFPGGGRRSVATATRCPSTGPPVYPAGCRRIPQRGRIRFLVVRG